MKRKRGKKKRFQFDDIKIPGWRRKKLRKKRKLENFHQRRGQEDGREDQTKPNRREKERKNCSKPVHGIINQTFPTWIHLQFNFHSSCLPTSLETRNVDAVSLLRFSLPRKLQFATLSVNLSSGNTFPDVSVHSSIPRIVLIVKNIEQRVQTSYLTNL